MAGPEFLFGVSSEMSGQTVDGAEVFGEGAAAEDTFEVPVVFDGLVGQDLVTVLELVLADFAAFG